LCSEYRQMVAICCQSLLSILPSMNHICCVNLFSHMPFD
jgi:hypothetical protein